MLNYILNKSIANPSNKLCAKSGGSPNVTWKNFNECKLWLLKCCKSQNLYYTCYIHVI